MNYRIYKKNIHKPSSCSLLAYLLLISISLVSASSISAEVQNNADSPEKLQIVTPYYQPRLSKFKPPLGEYVYKVSWQGIPAAFVNISVDRDGLNFKLSTKVRTNSGIDIFYKLRYSAGSEVSMLDFQPLKSYYESRENSRFQRADLKFSPEGEITSVYKKNEHDPKILKFNTNNITLDPFSAAFVARGLDWNVGDVRYFDTFNGKSRYLIQLKAVRQQEIHVNGKKRLAWVIRPHVEKLGGDKHSKLRKAEIYISADERREILQINSEVFVGTVKTKLIEYKPAKHSEPAIDLAALRKARLNPNLIP
jgi:hypothetical protein